VVLLATISKAGTIENVRVASGPEELLVCAIDAVRQWKYSPYLLNGEPTEAHTMISITFTLDGSVKSQGQGVGADSGTPQ